MVPVAMRAANVTNIFSWKTQPESLCPLIKDTCVFVVHLYLVIQCEIQSTDTFGIVVYF